MTETISTTPMIICPLWCSIGAQQHAKGDTAHNDEVFHRSAQVDDDLLAAAALELATFPDGTPLPGERPRIYLNEAGRSEDGLLLSDARYLAEQILAAVEAASA